MLDKWAPWYKNANEPAPYGTSDAYRLGAEHLKGCALVEDWGCGLGWFRRFVPAERYRGVDGTTSPFADVVADLREYRSSVPGVFMRGVLEHNFEWRKVLLNALASFAERMCLVLFTPMDVVPRLLSMHPELDVPDLSMSHFELENEFTGLSFRCERITSDTAYGSETLYYLEKLNAEQTS